MKFKSILTAELINFVILLFVVKIFVCHFFGPKTNFNNFIPNNLILVDVNYNSNMFYFNLLKTKKKTSKIKYIMEKIVVIYYLMFNFCNKNTRYNF